MKALRSFASKSGLWDRSGTLERTEDLEEFKTGMKEAQDWRLRYERILRSSEATESSGTGLVTSTRQFAVCLRETLGTDADNDWPPEVALVFDKVATSQMEISQLLDNYIGHLGQSVTKPMEGLLQELRQVEEEKLRCDEKRDAYDQQRARVAKVRPRHAGGSGGGTPVKGTGGDAELQAARDTFEEHSMALGCLLSSLEQRRPRSLLAQAAQLNAAQVRFFAAGLQAARAVQRDIRELARQRNMDRRLLDVDGRDDSMYEWDVAEPSSYVSPCSASPTGVWEVSGRELPPEVPTDNDPEWRSLMSSLALRLAEMGEGTLDEHDTLLAMHAMKSAAAEAARMAAHARACTGSAPARDAGNWWQSSGYSSKSEPLTSGGSPAREPLPGCSCQTGALGVLPSLAAAHASGSCTSGVAMSSTSGSTGIAAVLPAQPTRSGSPCFPAPLPMPASTAPALAGRCQSTPLQPLAGGTGASEVGGPGRALPLPEAMDEAHCSTGAGASKSISSGLNGSVKTSPWASVPAGSAGHAARLTQSGPLSSTPPSTRLVSQQHVPNWSGYSHPVPQPLPASGSTVGCSGSNSACLRGGLRKPEGAPRNPLSLARSPSMSPPHISELHKLPPPPLDTSSGPSTSLSPPDRPPALHMGLQSVSGSEAGVGEARSPSPLPPPPLGAAMGRGWLPSSSGRPVATKARSGRTHLPSAGGSMAAGAGGEREDGSLSPRPRVAPGTTAGSASVPGFGPTQLMSHASLPSGGLGHAAAWEGPWDVDGVADSRQASGGEASRSGHFRVGAHPAGASARAAGAGPGGAGARSGVSGSERGALGARLAGEDVKWRELEEVHPGGVVGLPRWSSLTDEQREALLQDLASVVISKRQETFGKSHDPFPATRSLSFTEGPCVGGGIVSVGH